MLDVEGMNVLKVGLSTTTIEPAITDGRLDGIGVYTDALLTGLPSAGCEVTGYAFPSLKNGALAKRFSLSKVLPSSYSALSLRDVITPKTVAITLPVDIYHATDYRIVRTTSPIVATLHDAIPIKYPEWCSPRLRRLKNWVQKKAAAKANHVIALSNYAVAELVECFGVDEKNITVVQCGVAPEWKQPSDPAAVDTTLHQYGLRPGYFLFVGTFQPRKNVDRILEAYLRLPDAIRQTRQLLLVGRVGWLCDELIGKIKAAIQRGEHVVWLSNVSSQVQLRHLYAGAGVFVFPSLYEGFGIPVTEAFSSGVPVITSNTTSLPEVSQGAALEINPMSVPEIGTAMQDLSTNEALRQQCIDAGRKRAAQFTWQRTVEETVAVYRSVLAS